VGIGALLARAGAVAQAEGGSFARSFGRLAAAKGREQLTAAPWALAQIATKRSPALQRALGFVQEAHATRNDDKSEKNDSYKEGKERAEEAEEKNERRYQREVDRVQAAISGQSSSTLQIIHDDLNEIKGLLGAGFQKSTKETKGLLSSLIGGIASLALAIPGIGVTVAGAVAKLRGAIGLSGKTAQTAATGAEVTRATTAGVEATQAATAGAEATRAAGVASKVGMLGRLSRFGKVLGPVGAALGIGSAGYDMWNNGINTVNSGDMLAAGAMLSGNPVALAASGGWTAGRLIGDHMEKSEGGRRRLRNIGGTIGEITGFNREHEDLMNSVDNTAALRRAQQLAEFDRANPNATQEYRRWFIGAQNSSGGITPFRGQKETTSAPTSSAANIAAAPRVPTVLPSTMTAEKLLTELVSSALDKSKGLYINMSDDAKRSPESLLGSIFGSPESSPTAPAPRGGGGVGRVGPIPSGNANARAGSNTGSLIAEAKAAGLTDAQIAYTMETDRLVGAPAGTTLAQVKTESGFRRDARSPTGAVGLTQFTTTAIDDNLFGRAARTAAERRQREENRARMSSDPDFALSQQRQLLQTNLRRRQQSGRDTSYTAIYGDYGDQAIRDQYVARIESNRGASVPSLAITPTAAAYKPGADWRQTMSMVPANLQPRMIQTQSALDLLATQNNFLTSSTIRSQREQNSLLARGGVPNSHHLGRNGGTARDFSIRGKTPQQIAAMRAALSSAGFFTLVHGEGNNRHLHAELKNGRELSPEMRERVRSAQGSDSMNGLLAGLRHANNQSRQPAIPAALAAPAPVAMPVSRPPVAPNRAANIPMVISNPEGTFRSIIMGNLAASI